MNGNGTAIRASGAAIRAIRVAQGRGIRQLAEDTGFTRGYLSRLETGHLGASPETIAIVADSLNVPIEAITRADIADGEILSEQAKAKLWLQWWDSAKT